MKAIGTFDVKLSSLDFDLNGKNGLTLERMAINKIFLGDLEATSQGEMLSAITTTQVVGRLCSHGTSKWYFGR